MTDFIIGSELVEARDAQRLNIPAKRLMEKLGPIPSTVDDLKRRWFWELLQNASDYNETVDVILELSEDVVVFKHNGNPFRAIDTENLIAPDSGKDDQEIRSIDMIGQFGTGFISTHVLSFRITVAGVIRSEKEESQFAQFKFDLNRKEYQDKEKLKESIAASSSQLEKSLELITYNSTLFNTSFTYHLKENIAGLDSTAIVADGLAYVMDMLPYTLSCMPKIQSVKILNHGVGSFLPGETFISILNRNDD